MKMHHVKGYTDKTKSEDQLTFPDKLNIRANTIISSKVRVPIPTHILNTVIAIYINNKYCPNKYSKVIRSYCGVEESKSV